MKRSFVTWNAFSLVELLVVIAIIGILAALILTSVSRVKKHTQVTVDLSNQKQILTAMLMYVSDNQDSLPNPGYGRSNPCWAYAANLPSGPVGGAGPAFDAILRAQQDSFANGQLAPHLRACSLLKCPGDTPASDPRFYQRKVYISSYVWNAAIIGYADQRPPFKISRFSPNDILQWEQDEKEETFYFNDCANRPDELLSRRHGKIGPVGLFDGSAQQIKCKEFEDLALAPTANRLWCRPDSSTGR
jgi:prepilin-type N-terminal cleavage/methylation domain-containing protein